MLKIHNLLAITQVKRLCVVKDSFPSKAEDNRRAKA